ncbi:hypothetical protein BGZ80_005342 [Entomortierella chlamydospora]|uniref:ER-bound oxygenase mpaB/mpaB'/Rubber oxygenase catalytic domain-containing protein n=1 Tax=Entomortierella chlamydospora TaxID=101097 RepID=A0A9P6T2B8_9FUNG|nr:hypothetical protein BGZ80_005342 [Entomortierella chlamydospora]
MLKKYPDPTLPLRDLEVANEMSHHGIKRAEDTNYLLAEALQSHSRRAARSVIVDEVDPVTGNITTRLRNTTRDTEEKGNVDEEELQERLNDEKRAQAAVERINFIHSHYRILQGDFTHTLAMFAIEPSHWINRFEWRQLTELENNAMLAIWTNFARKIGIEEIPETVQEFRQWVEDYEIKNIKSAPSNRSMADSSIATSQTMVSTPKAKSRVRKLIIALMGPRYRNALGYEEPSRAQVFLSESILWVRGCIVKYLMMPRTVPNLRSAMCATRFEDVEVENIQINSKSSDRNKASQDSSATDSENGCPFTGGVRYVPRLFDLKQLYPRGYKIEELDPAAYFGKGPNTCPVASLDVAPAL